MFAAPVPLAADIFADNHTQAYVWPRQLIVEWRRRAARAAVADAGGRHFAAAVSSGELTWNSLGVTFSRSRASDAVALDMRAIEAAYLTTATDPAAAGRSRALLNIDVHERHPPHEPRAAPTTSAWHAASSWRTGLLHPLLRDGYARVASWGFNTTALAETCSREWRTGKCPRGDTRPVDAAGSHAALAA